MRYSLAPRRLPRAPSNDGNIGYRYVARGSTDLISLLLTHGVKLTHCSVKLHNVLGIRACFDKCKFILSALTFGQCAELDVGGQPFQLFGSATGELGRGDVLHLHTDSVGRVWRYACECQTHMSTANDDTRMTGTALHIGRY